MSKNISEEIKRMKDLFGFEYKNNSHDVLSEEVINRSIIKEQSSRQIMDQKQGISRRERKKRAKARREGAGSIVAPNWGDNKRGDLNFGSTGVPGGVLAYLEIDGIESYIKTMSLALTTQQIGEPGMPPDDPITTQLGPITLALNLTDPFDFNSIALTTQGQTDFDAWVATYNQLRQNNIAVWPAYLQFLRDQGGIPLNGYASRDEDPNVSIKGEYAPCRRESGQLRSAYNLCLSQARAQAMVIAARTSY